ncbi:VOC family protein [Candidatus Shapirobacteria bacterium]|nr:VOC family protein [Candidatus Shapirobacteria bacterium]
MQYQKISTILIWSENWKQLADWYQNTLELKVVEEINHPQDTGRLFEFFAGGTWLWIGQHSEVKGLSKDPCRIMFNINVDSVQQAYDDLLSKGVKFIASPFKAPTFDKWFATFSDLDGNLVQLIGPKE